MANPQKFLIPCDRHERLHYIKRQFSAAKGVDLSADFAGGRGAAFKKMLAIDAVAYNKNRNFLNGAVTHLSPYLRHGCITLSEVFNEVKTRFGHEAEKLLFQLAWRDYWRRVWYQEGDKIHHEMEPPKVAISHLPLGDEVQNGQTGLPCMDAFIADLLNTGYVHNHGRMWLASYIVHHLKMDWRQAADWFESYLLDGDMASNHLSWQWVTSTFSSKPYFFNKDNLSRYTGDKFCGSCKVECPFDASYEQLNERLFSKTLVPIAKRYPKEAVAQHPTATHPNLAVFVHDEMLSVAHPLLTKPYPKIFVFDPKIHGAWSLQRLQFVADCLNDMDNVEVWRGDTYEVLMQREVGQLVTQDTPNLAIKHTLAPFLPTYESEPAFVNVDISEKRLKRFSRYWEKVGPLVLGDVAYRAP